MSAGKVIGNIKKGNLFHMEQSAAGTPDLCSLAIIDDASETHKKSIFPAHKKKHK